MNDLGHLGEQQVGAFLMHHGFTIRAYNFRCRVGEVDVIAQKDDLVAFVEVKTRRHEYFPTELVVTRSKQQKIMRAAQKFALQQHLDHHVLRFDVAIVVGDESRLRIENYIENAFQ